jgi:hypothetical protein
MALFDPRITKKKARKSLIYTLLEVFGKPACGGSGTRTFPQKPDNQLVTRYFFSGKPAGKPENYQLESKNQHRGFTAEQR